MLWLISTDLDSAPRLCIFALFMHITSFNAVSHLTANLTFYFQTPLIYLCLTKKQTHSGNFMHISVNIFVSAPQKYLSRSFPKAEQELNKEFSKFWLT